MADRNFKDVILATIGEELIEAIVIKDTIYGETDRNPPSLLAVLNKVISWEVAAPLLDYTWYSGYGNMDCHDIVVWTTTKIYFVHEYDGSTCLNFVYRNPIDYIKEE